MPYKRILIVAILIASVLANFYFIFVYKGSNSRTLKENMGRLYHQVMQGGEELESLCFFHRYSEIQRRDFITTIPDAKPLPEKLIVSPGIYSINGRTVDMQQEGLYRIIFVGQKNYQVIVYKNDLEVLLGSLSWIVTHGNKDNKMEYEHLLEKAENDKLFLTCGHVTSFAVSVLTDLGYSARPTLGISKDTRNHYNDEHMQLEVFHPKLNRWILVDLDNNLLFEDKKNHQLLNLIEARTHINNNNVSFRHIANDAFADVSGFSDDAGYSYAFFAETLKSDSAKMAWYKKVLGVITIGGYYYDVSATGIVKDLQSDFRYMDSTTFHHKFYDMSVVMK